jgi:putative Holliday junction resolvase
LEPFVFYMSRILAIDFGKKRIGLAVTDPLKIICTGLPTISNAEFFNFIKQYCSQESIEAFVIGESKNLDNTKSQVADDIESFAKKLQLLFPEVPIHWIDERFTSKMAKQSMIFSGMKKKKRQQKEIVDEISATIILQSYLEKTQL